MIRLRAAVTVLVLAVAVAAACERADEQTGNTPQPAVTAATSVRFDTATITFVSGDRQVPMRVEVAEREDQRAWGLMDRDDLASDAGMIFLYDRMQHQDTGFWMYRTRIPLDIAFFDSSARIVAIHQMMPCTSTDAARCTGYAAGVPYYGAVEANRGWFARNGIGIGDRITMRGRLGQ